MRLSYMWAEASFIAQFLTIPFADKHFRITEKYYVIIVIFENYKEHYYMKALGI